MNIIVYIIFGWLTGEFFHLTIWEWCKSKFKLDQKRVKTILIFVGIALIIAVIGSGFYRVQSTENVILTKLSGNKVIINDYGIKYSLLSSRETINIQKQLLKFPLGDDKSYQIITKDNKPLSIHSFLEYRIIDSKKWAIDNKDSQNKLGVTFATATKNIIQKSDYDYIRSNLKVLDFNLQEEMSNIKDVYGVEIIKTSFQLSDTDDVTSAKSKAEAQKINSEAERNANILLKDSLDIFTSEQLEYMKTRMLSENGNIKWVISGGSQVIVDSKND